MGKLAVIPCLKLIGEGGREGRRGAVKHRQRTYVAVFVSLERRLLELEGVDLEDAGEDDVVEEEKGENEEDHEQGDVPGVQVVVGLEGKGRGKDEEGGEEGRKFKF